MARLMASSMATALALAAASPAAAAEPARCVSDAELEATVGEQIRSGAFAVSTATLGNRAPCSGLPMAQAIQELRERLVPSQAQPLAEIPDPPRPDRVTPQPYARPSGRGLARYAGSLPWDRVDGRAFMQEPAVVAGLSRAGVTPELRREMARHEVGRPIELDGDVLVVQACYAQQCSDLNYTLFVNADTGASALCLYDAGRVGRMAHWYAIGGRPITLPRSCPGTLDEAPGPIQRAVGPRTMGGGR